MTKTNIKLTKHLIFIFLVSVLACNSSQTINPKTDPISKKQNPIKDLFPDGSHNVSYTCSNELTENQKIVYKKFFEKIGSNMNEFENYLRKIYTSDSFEYDKALGLTKNEFDTLLKVFYNYDTLTKKGKLIITSDEKTIQFKGAGRLVCLDSLIINLGSSEIRFKNHFLKYDTTLETLSNSISYDPTDFEYFFSYYGPSGGILDLIPSPLSNQYELIFGRLNKTKKTILEFSGVEIIDNVRSGFIYSIEFD